MKIYLLIFAMLATSTTAQERVISAISGVGDRGQDTILLEINANDPSALDLVVVTRGGFNWGDPPIITRVENAMYLGSANRPELAQRETGALAINDLGCFACGRYHHGMEIVIDYRAGAWQVIGVWESAVDRLGPWRAHTCDVNLVTGGVEISLAEQPPEWFQTEERAFPITDLHMDYSPKVCKRTQLSEEEWLALKPADWED